MPGTRYPIPNTQYQYNTNTEDRQSHILLKLFKSILPLYIGAALGPLGGFGVVTLLPILARDWAVEFGTASLAISFYMVPFIIVCWCDFIFTRAVIR